MEWVKHAVPEGVREAWREWMRAGEEVGKVEEGYAVVRGGEEVGGGVAGYDDHGVQEAERRNRREDASEFCFLICRVFVPNYVDGWMGWGANESCCLGIWTQLALAYAIHKSFIFIRVPLAVAVTPKVVKVLRGWGWDIGKRRPKGVK